MEQIRERLRAGAAMGALVAATAVMGACAQSGDSGTAASSDEPVGAVQQPAHTPSSESPDTAPPPERPAEPVDLELASEGEQLFSRRGCVACHKIGEGRLVGPDLMGVTDRRSYDWIFAMVTAPDSMLRDDQTAKDLFAEYFTPMPDQKISADEARALYEYMRARTEGAMQSSGAETPESDVAMGRHRHSGRMGLAGRGPRSGRGPRAGQGRRHRHHQGT